MWRGPVSSSTRRILARRGEARFTGACDAKPDVVVLVVGVVVVPVGGTQVVLVVVPRAAPQPPKRTDSSFSLPLAHRNHRPSREQRKR